VNPGGGAGWDDSPLDIQVPDDARELERDVIAYHRELRAKRRRSRLRRLAAPLRGSGTIMPLLASILAVCLVAGAMLSVATLSPADGSHEAPPTHQPTVAASTAASSTTASSTTGSSTASPKPSHSATARPSSTAGFSPTPRGTTRTATAQP
jgi:cytoskeletal protein RodZ